MRTQAYFVSDLHLGSEFKGACPKREEHFCEFLRDVSPLASHLFILGDLFEFWMEYRYYIPKMHFKVLSQLKQLIDSGVEIHYLSGNHDFNLGAFFSREIGIATHHHPLKINLQGKSLYLLHGDGMASSDVRYRAVKKVLVHPLANWGFKQLHPDWGMSLAKTVGFLSRKRQKPSNKNEYQAASIGYFAQNNVDIVVHGHTHYHFVRELPEGVYVNSGEWVEKLQYIHMENGVCSARSYSPAL